MPETVPWVRVEVRRRLRLEHQRLTSSGCVACRDGCGCAFRAPSGCGHYACLAADNALADTCPAAVATITSAGLAEVRGA